MRIAKREWICTDLFRKIEKNESKALGRKAHKARTMQLDALNDDLIENIAGRLPIMELLNLVQSCNHLFKRRYELIKCNDQYREYMQFDTYASYFSVFFKSDLVYNNKQYVIKSDISNDHVSAYNTYKIIAFNNRGASDNDKLVCRILIINKYFEKKYKQIYGTHVNIKSINYANLFNKFMDLYNWTDHIYINIFNIYEILYHIKTRNLRALYNTLNNLRIQCVSIQNEFMSIVDALLNFSDILNTRLLRSAMFYVLYAFIETNKDFFPEKLQITLVGRSEYIITELMRCKFPLYLKTLIAEQIRRTCNSI